MVKRCDSESGFTLTEVVISIVVITTLAGAFAPLIASSVRGIKLAGVRLQSLYSMRGEMERRLATFSGEKRKVTIKGRNQDGRADDWVVEGLQITVSGSGSEQQGEELLVSFVIPEEQPL
jgi:prepilin-type N-terminal cleavage/methylation domain-containing protein